jgi:hypothetical protein
MSRPEARAEADSDKASMPSAQPLSTRQQGSLCVDRTGTGERAACWWAQGCPGPGTVYLGPTFESPELVFVRSLEVDA